jgi:hypothetical protein
MSFAARNSTGRYKARGTVSQLFDDDLAFLFLLAGLADSLLDASLFPFAPALDFLLPLSCHLP